MVMVQQTMDQYNNEDIITTTSDIRSVGMSANIASSVCKEVNHLIHVTPGFSIEDSLNISRIMEQNSVNNLDDSGEDVCSVVLPSENNILLAVVLSKWDDIVGPQTVHMWLQNNNNDIVSKAVHYVTCHTVNCTSVSATNSASNMLIVPDFNMVSISYLHHSGHYTPFSLALLANIQYYTFLQQRFGLVQIWLKRLIERLIPVLGKFEPSDLDFDIEEEVSRWIIKLSSDISWLRDASLNAVELNKDVLKRPTLSYALTSHLQTFGCTVVMGTRPADVNAVIMLLSLFLEENEKYCSQIVPSSGQFCGFNIGLYLQGLLLNAFGYREISSIDLVCNEFPVTTYDLTRDMDDGAVKQSPLDHRNIDSHQRNGMDTLTRSLLHPVRDSSKLVCNLLSELSLLPVSDWSKHVSYFKKRISSLSQVLITLLEKNNSNQTIQQFKQSLSLSEADFLIVLTQSEKFKRGFLSLILSNRLLS